MTRVNKRKISTYVHLMKQIKVFLLTVPVFFQASPSRPGEPSFVIVQPGYPGSTSLAKNFMAELAGALTRQGGPAGLQGSYYNETEAALKAIQQKKPSFGIVSLGFFLAHRKSLQLEAILESPLERFYLAAKKGEPVSLKDLAGQDVEGTPFHEMEFVSRILFGPGAGGGPVSPGSSDNRQAGGQGEEKGSAAGGKENPPSGGLPFKPVADVKSWKATASAGFSRGIRNVSRGKARAVLLNARERKTMTNLTAGKSLQVFYQTERLPTALVVSLGKKGESAREGARALQGMKDSPEGRKLLVYMGIDGFVPVDLKLLERLMLRYKRDGEEEKVGAAASGN